MTSMLEACCSLRGMVEKKIAFSRGSKLALGMFNEVKWEDVPTKVITFLIEIKCASSKIFLN